MNDFTKAWVGEVVVEAALDIDTNPRPPSVLVILISLTWMNETQVLDQRTHRTNVEPIGKQQAISTWLIFLPIVHETTAAPPAAFL